jgi:hypothetical protein
MSRRAVLIISMGKPYYIGMGTSFARSFFHSNRGNGIELIIATDNPQAFPKDVRDAARFTIVEKHHGVGFHTKLHIDQLSDADQTLYVDADCLVYRDLTPAFQELATVPFGVKGIKRVKGGVKDYDDVEALMKKFNVPYVIQLMGATFFFDRSEVAGRVFQRARELDRQYEEHGFKIHRGQHSDEICYALAVGEEGIEPFPDDGSIRGDAIYFRTRLETNVLTGKTILENVPGKLGYQPNWPFRSCSPAIIHFPNEFTEIPAYLVDVATLRFLYEKGLPPALARLMAQVTVGVPQRLIRWGKTTFRPVFHQLLGARKIKSQRN